MSAILGGHSFFCVHIFCLSFKSAKGTRVKVVRYFVDL